MLGEQTVAALPVVGFFARAGGKPQQGLVGYVGHTRKAPLCGTPTAGVRVVAAGIEDGELESVLHRIKGVDDALDIQALIFQVFILVDLCL